MPGPDHVKVKLEEGLNVGAIKTRLFVQERFCAVPVPATITGAFVAVATVITTLEEHPLVEVIIAV